MFISIWITSHPSILETIYDELITTTATTPTSINNSSTNTTLLYKVHNININIVSQDNSLALNRFQLRGNKSTEILIYLVKQFGICLNNSEQNNHVNNYIYFNLI